MYRNFGKRAFDTAAAVALLFVFAPVMVLIGIVVRFSMGRPVLFTQRRPGLNEKLFNVMKFRTMLPQPVGEAELSDSARLTTTGRILRATSLDELPQLINVIRGEMSLVGPRPLLPEYLPLYTETERLRHSVRPGITGLSQINGRNALLPHERFRYDVQYARGLTFAGDVAILTRTVLAVLLRSGVQVAPAEQNGAVSAEWAQRISAAAVRADSERRSI